MLNVDETNNEKNIILVYPNPVENFLNAKIKNTQNKILDISVYDFSGKLLKKGLKDVNKNSSGDISLDLSFLKKGNYIINFSTENFSKSIKIVKK